MLSSCLILKNKLFICEIFKLFLKALKYSFVLTLAAFLILNMDQYDVMSVTEVFLFHFFLNEDKVLLEDIPQTVGSCCLFVCLFFKILQANPVF